MKLSLISLDNKYKKDVKKYLKDLVEQDNQDFEVILCLNHSNEEAQVVKVISEYYDFFKERLIVIYNSKINSYQYNLLSAFKLANGDFIAVINSKSHLKKNYVSEIVNQAKFYDVDILELKPRIIGSISWKPKLRQQIDKSVLISKNKSVIAYAFPFIFNKIFKKQLVKKVINYIPANNYDTKMCIEINYILLLEAKTYMYLDYRIYREYFDSDIWFNTKYFLGSFNGIEKWMLNKPIEDRCAEEFIYAKSYFIKLLLTGFLTGTSLMYRTIFFNERSIIKEKRSKFLLDKHFELLTKLENQFCANNYDSSNPYIRKASTEASLILSDSKKLRKIPILSALE
ncbi:glycosyltransferase [Mycoplasma sp. 4013]